MKNKELKDIAEMIGSAIERAVKKHASTLSAETIMLCNPSGARVELTSFKDDINTLLSKANTSLDKLKSKNGGSAPQGYTG